MDIEYYRGRETKGIDLRIAKLVEPRKTYFLFEFSKPFEDGDGFDHYIINRLPNGMYSFECGNLKYVVNSWKDEIRSITDGKVNYA